ncbi:M20 metallopeptidase family protein [Amycolatopsis anabasis]|uniref:M20 metallopeptidase family protein n=1 Tax=Amycolatopsis anabasis TaxID=1840409 RepID=UPI00131C7DE1|nr:M20 family metallopeptidase [Amycolatopsis anabasis]
MTLREDAAELSGDLARLRRALHQEPEVGLHLPRTQDKVLGALDGLPLEITTGKSLSSVTAVLRGGKPGPAVLLRGDMDALPVAERSGEDFTSRLDGVMHACGHDLHTAGLVGAAQLLSARQADLAGDIVFMFQPGEEGFDGAGHMINEGVLEAAGRPVDAAYGLHVTSSMFPAGTFVCRPGPLMAASDGLFVRVVGAGGHGSQPHRALDPVPAACEMVTGLQTMVSRRFDVFDPVVVTVGTFHAGTKRNIIPEEATFEATVRSFSVEARERLREHAVKLCQDIAAAHGLEVEVSYETEYPVTVNHADGHEFVASTVREVFGEERFVDLPHPMTGSEDFSRVLNAVPGAFVFLGATQADDPDSAPTNHSPLATFDDGVLADGAALLAELATRRLALA